jgi:hypothetical protein
MGCEQGALFLSCNIEDSHPHLIFQVDVNGDNAAPIYKFLKSSKGGLFGDSIKWNFSKFLVDNEGRVVDRYAPTTSPLSIEVNIIMDINSEIPPSFVNILVVLFVIFSEGCQEAAWNCLITYVESDNYACFIFGFLVWTE